MSLSEFDLIATYFSRAAGRDDVRLGVGDDAAVVAVPAGRELVITTDTLVEGVHFRAGADAEGLGHKALAVNLSDLAAMGAEPAWFTLSLTLPGAEPAWLEGFARGLYGEAARHGVALVGGDTTRGPLAVTIQALGLAASGRVLTRAGARAGDGIWVTGTLGDAALALDPPPGLGADTRAWLQRRLDRPEPRVAHGRRLSGVAWACIDISDGLLADLGHVLKASNVGARLWVDRVPRSEAFRHAVAPDDPAWLRLPLAGGDDYELLFTLDPAHADRLLPELADLGLPVTRIGEVEAEPGLRCLHDDGTPCAIDGTGWEHFDPDTVA